MPIRNVVITGAGIVSPLGISVGDTLDAVAAGKSGISRLEGTEGWPQYLQYAGLIDELPDLGEIDRKLMSQMKFLNRGAMLGFHSAREAMESSGVNLDDIPMERRALYVGSGDFTNIDHHFMFEAVKDATGGKWEDVDTAKLNSSSLGKVNPFFLLESITNNIFSFLSAYYGLMGPNTSMGMQSPCGSNAVELAARSIEQGRADIAMAVGSGNWATEVALYELRGLGMASECRDGAASFRPFDAARDGFIPAEGGATLLLESEERAAARGAKILGRITGFGNSIEHTGGQSFAMAERVHERCVREALAEAGLDAGELGMLIACGKATREGDRSELQSIASVLGGADVPVCGLKPYTGHMGAASDVAELIIGMRAIANKTVPATLNFNSVDTGFEGLNISSSTQSTEGGSFLAVSYGVGGESSAVVVEVA